MNVYVEVTHTAQSGGRGCHVLFVEARGPLNPSGTVGWDNAGDLYPQHLLKKVNKKNTKLS